MEVGDILLNPISDGTFVARPSYFGDHASAEGHGDLFDRRDQAWLPIGCFLLRTGDRCVLVDAGMGPTEQGAGNQDAPAQLIGGQLPVGLRAAGVERDEVTDVVCTHLHPDHVGWVQLDEPTWHSMGDVDPDLANRTRERMWRELEGDDVTGAGAHFPELEFGRVLQGNGKRWWT
jgi:glyoxylase-like metal-dependent hydrolase (beta-lactamase superfamily II)